MDKLPNSWHGQEHYMSVGRQLLAVSDNTWTIAFIVAGSLIGLLILGVAGFLIWTKCGRAPSSPVHPVNDKDFEKGHAVAAQPAGMQSLMMSIPGLQPVPPWEQYGQPPPGIMLSPSIPTGFTPFSSNPRPASAPPYERLVLVSSRVHQPMKVAEAVLPNVAVVVYDWKLFTLQELLSHIKRTIGPGSKVTSIAVVAPGNKPGCVALLEGQTSDKDKLAAGTGELAQFWRVLAGCVAANGVSDGRRVDLIGCRVLESPQEGAALLKALWTLTSVPFAAADDALLGYQLATFLEEPHSGALSVIASTIQAIDLYFNRHTLLGIQPPTAVQGAAPQGLLPPLPSSMYAPPLPAGAPPAAALQQLPQVAAGVTPLSAAPQQPILQPSLPPTLQQPLQAAVPQQAAAAAAVAAATAPKDIFARFAAAVTASGSTPAATFAKYDKDKSGYLGQDEVIYMVTEVVPGTSALDAEHFRAMMDLDGNQQISQAEFVTALTDNSKASTAARAGRDENSLMTTLHDYLTDNDAVIRNYFNEADVDKTGTLNHSEVVALVTQIPGLELSEQKLIASYLYQYDTSGKGLLTFDQLKAAVRAYGTPSAKAAVQTPFPNQTAAAAAAAPLLGTAAAVPTMPVAAAAPPTQASAAAVPTMPVAAAAPPAAAPLQAGYAPLTPAAGMPMPAGLQQPGAVLLPPVQQAAPITPGVLPSSLQPVGAPLAAVTQPAQAMPGAVLPNPTQAASLLPAGYQQAPPLAGAQLPAALQQPATVAGQGQVPAAGSAPALPPAYQVLTPVPLASAPAGAILAQPGQLLSSAAPVAPASNLTSLAAAPKLPPTAGLPAPATSVSSLAAAPSPAPTAGLPVQTLPPVQNIAAVSPQNIAAVTPSVTQGAMPVQGTVPAPAAQAGQAGPAGPAVLQPPTLATPVQAAQTAWQQPSSAAIPAATALQPPPGSAPAIALQGGLAGQPAVAQQPGAGLPYTQAPQAAAALQPAQALSTAAGSARPATGLPAAPSGLSIPTAAGQKA